MDSVHLLVDSVVVVVDGRWIRLGHSFKDVNGGISCYQCDSSSINVVLMA